MIFVKDIIFWFRVVDIILIGEVLILLDYSIIYIGGFIREVYVVSIIFISGGFLVVVIYFSIVVIRFIWIVRYLIFGFILFRLVLIG